MPGTDPAAADTDLEVDADPAEVVVQARSLFGVHDNLSRVLRDLNLPADDLPDGYDDADKSADTFEYEAILRVFLYMYVGDLSQNEAADRIAKLSFLQQRFGLDRSPTQQDISYAERRRLPLAVRQFLSTVADGIQGVAAEKGIQSSEIADPDPPDPDEVAASDRPLYQYVDDNAPAVISETLDTVTPAFDTGRAANTQHTDRDVWEQQTVMSLMDRAGTRQSHRTFNKFHHNPAHHDTHVRAVKQLGTPGGYQFTFDDFAANDWAGEPVPEWRRIADTIQTQFNDAVATMLDSVRVSEMFTEPVVAAIDVTGVPFHVSPWKGDADIEPDDERVVVDEETGQTKVPKEDYPAMVNGSMDSDKAYEYQYATLTIVGRNTPLVLAVEPIRHDSDWEGNDGESVSYAEVVDRLMEQATDLVDIHLVMADKAFDQHGVFHVLDQRHDVNYVIPKKADSEYLRQQVAEVREDDAVQARVERDAALYLRDDTPYIDGEEAPAVGEDGYSHDVTFMHVPAERDDWIVRHADDTGYAIFATNRDDVSPMDAEALTDRYSDRWDIENEYKMITPLVPSIASTDYRMRFFSFVFSCLLYNMWRVVDHDLKEMAAEAYDEYGRGPHEDRLDTLVGLADFLASSIVLMFSDGLDPPDFAA